MLKFSKNKIIVVQSCLLVLLVSIFVLQVCYNNISNKSHSGVDMKIKIVDESAHLDNVRYASRIYFNIKGKNVDVDITASTKFVDCEDVTEGVVYVIETNNLDLIHSKVLEVRY